MPTAKRSPPKASSSRRGARRGTRQRNRRRAPGVRRRTLRSRAESRLRAYALSYPEAHEDFPWGERVVKVHGKVFLFMGRLDGGGLGLSVKLPGSASLALGLPFASPTAYGLGRSGWVTARFGTRETPPLDLLERWVDESYRAVAPKRLVRALDARTP